MRGSFVESTAASCRLERWVLINAYEILEVLSSQGSKRSALPGDLSPSSAY